MKVLIAGSSGLVGSHLKEVLEKNGIQVSLLVRRKPKSEKEIYWNPITKTLSPDAIKDFDAIVCLSGESIATYWTKRKKFQILESRINAVETISNAIESLSTKKPRLLCASAIGFYGHREDELLSEESSKGKGFLSDVCKAWEDAGAKSSATCIRLGVILSKKGGALSKMLPSFKVGFGAIPGSGKQYLSWITLDDVAEIFLFLLHHPEINGPVNAVSPEPVQAKTFYKTLASKLHRPCAIYIPAWFLKALLGEMAFEMLLASSRVQPKALLTHGFRFKHSTIENAFEDLLLK